MAAGFTHRHDLGPTRGILGRTSADGSRTSSTLRLRTINETGVESWTHQCAQKRRRCVRRSKIASNGYGKGRKVALSVSKVVQWLRPSNQPQSSDHSHRSAAKDTLCLALFVGQNMRGLQDTRSRMHPTSLVSACFGTDLIKIVWLTQDSQRRSVNADRLTSRDRISRLEQQIANLTSAATAGRQGSLSSPVENDYHPDDDDNPSTPIDDPGMTDEPGEGPTDTPPTHIKFLFDNALIGPEQHEDFPGDDLSKARVSPRYLEQARARLQRLMPTKYGMPFTWNRMILIMLT